MLKDKATINLRAGEALFALAMNDPAASRCYYALYQASVHALTRAGWTPGRLQSGALEWSHVVVMNNMYLVRRRRSDRALFETMRALRTQADYGADSIDPAVLASRLAHVRDLVEETTR